MTMDLRTLSAELFEPLSGSSFTLEGNEGVFTALLVKCPINPRGTMPGAAREAFSLIFSAPADHVPSFNGGDFIVRHPEMEPFGPVYVERIFSHPPDKALLQIIFN